jgi:hypothetical protein
MEKVYTVGKMAEVMKVNIFMIENMDMVYIHGQMDINILGIGKMEKDKEKENMY